MEKIISYTLSTEGIFPEEAVLGGIQGEHRATAVEVTPTVELAEKIAEFKAQGREVELQFEAILSSGEAVLKEKRRSDDIFAPFYLSREMTLSGLDLKIIVKLFVFGEEEREYCRGIIKLYFTPCPSTEGYPVFDEDKELCDKRAEEILNEFDQKAQHYEEIISLKAESAASSAATAARHLKRVEEISAEAENTRATLENGMELSILGGGADAVLPAIPEGDNRLLMRGVFGYREDTYQNWSDKNPVLSRGEPALVSDARDENWLKIGDGVTPWRELPFMHGPKGEKGERGERGERGIQGEKGERGEQGQSGKDAVTDQTFTPESSNAQSGIAVAQALKSVSRGSYEVMANITIPEGYSSDSYILNAEKYPAIAKITDFYIEMIIPKQSEVISGVLNINAKTVSGTRITVARFENWNNVNYNLKGYVFSKYYGTKRHNQYYGFGANATQNMANYCLLNSSGFGKFNELTLSLGNAAKALPAGMQIKIEGFKEE